MPRPWQLCHVHFSFGSLCTHMDRLKIEALDVLLRVSPLQLSSPLRAISIIISEIKYSCTLAVREVGGQKKPACLHFIGRLFFFFSLPSLQLSLKYECFLEPLLLLLLWSDFFTHRFGSEAWKNISSYTADKTTNFPLRQFSHTLKQEVPAKVSFLSIPDSVT